MSIQPICALWPAFFSLTLSACSSLSALAGENFTLEGELPPDFSLRAQAHYGVAKGCDGRSRAKSFESGFQKAAQQYRFTIPVSYRAGLCEMQLARVGLFIHGRYGDKDWQQTYDNGGLVIVDKLPGGAPGFQAGGRLIKQAECSWLFKMSTAKSRFGEIDKLLSCKGAGAQLALTELSGKTVSMSFQESTDERPYMDRYWLKTVSGWRPCTGRWGTQLEELCTEPPQFRTFKTNGRECTVYPNCTE